MKTLSTLFFLTLSFCAAPLFSQIAETEATMSDGTQPALIVEHDLDRKEAEKVWKSYTKDIGKVDWDRKNKEHVLFNVVIPEIDREYAVTVVTKLEDKKATFWFKMDEDYLNSSDDADELKGAGKFLQSYKYALDRYQTEELLSDETDRLSDLEKDLKKLEKKNEKLHNEIEKAKEAIAKAEKEIEENIAEQESKNKEIEDQKSKVESVKKELQEIGKS